MEQDRVAATRLQKVAQCIKPSRQTQYSETEWQQRCDLAAAYRTAHSLGWDQYIYNHITLKVHGSEAAEDGPHFLINPFGLRFDEVYAGCLLRVNIDGKVLDPGDGSGPLLSQGFVVHSAVHRARPDLHCVAHNHHQPTVAVAMTKVGVLPLSQEAFDVWGQISYHDFEGTATDLGERERMAAALGPKNKVLILRNHGPLTGGKTIGEAFHAMMVITRACEYQQMAMAAVGGDLTQINIPSDEVVAESMARVRQSPKQSNYDPNELIFQAWKREMEDKYGAENIYR